MSDLWDLLIIPCLLIGGLLLVFGLLAFAELWNGGNDDDRKGKK